MAAAVADFRPKVAAAQQAEEGRRPPEVVLEPTLDILADLGAAPPARARCWSVSPPRRPARPGRDDLRLRRHKLAAKGADLIVANDVAAPGTGFGHDTNAV